MIVLPAPLNDGTYVLQISKVKNSPGEYSFLKLAHIMLPVIKALAITSFTKLNYQYVA
jgi:hypothetical protein